MFRCLTPWTHRFGWPQDDPDTGRTLEHCSDCGAVRKPIVDLPVNPRFNIRRYRPVAALAEQHVCAQTMEVS